MSEPTDKPEKPPKSEVPEYPAYPPPPPPPGAAYPAAPPMPYQYESAAPVVRRNGLGTAALVLAIIGLLLCWTVFGGIILGVLAVILGFIGRGRARRGEANNGGVAIAGIVLGFLSIIAGAVFIALYVWVWNFFGGDDYFDCLRKAGNDTAKQQQCEQQFEQRVSSKLSLTPTTTAR